MHPHSSLLISLHSISPPLARGSPLAIDHFMHTPSFPLYLCNTILIDHAAQGCRRRRCTNSCLIALSRFLQYNARKPMNHGVHKSIITESTLCTASIHAGESLGRKSTMKYSTGRSGESTVHTQARKHAFQKLRRASSIEPILRIQISTRSINEPYPLWEHLVLVKKVLIFLVFPHALEA